MINLVNEMSEISHIKRIINVKLLHINNND